MTAQDRLTETISPGQLVHSEQWEAWVGVGDQLATAITTPSEVSRISIPNNNDPTALNTSLVVTRAQPGTEGGKEERKENSHSACHYI